MDPGRDFDLKARERRELMKDMLSATWSPSAEDMVAVAE